MAFMSKSEKVIKLTYFLALMFQHFFNTPNPSKEEDNKSILLKENHPKNSTYQKLLNLFINQLIFFVLPNISLPILTIVVNTL